MNDSAIVAEFKSEQAAFESFKLIVLDKTAVTAFEEQGMAENELLQFREAFSFRGIDKMDCKLSVRYATDKDVKSEQTNAENSRYYKLVKQKRERKFLKASK